MDEIITLFGKQLVTVGPVGIFICIILVLYWRFAPKNYGNPGNQLQEIRRGVERIETSEQREMELFQLLVTQIQRIADICDRVDRRMNVH